MSEIFVAGDIHGNYQGLMESLNAAGWQEGDTIICVGDVTDRGKDNARTVSFLQEHECDVRLVQGNHELQHRKMLQYYHVLIKVPQIRLFAAGIFRTYKEGYTYPKTKEELKEYECSADKRIEIIQGKPKTFHAFVRAFIAYTFVVQLLLYLARISRQANKDYKIVITSRLPSGGRLFSFEKMFDETCERHTISVVRQIINRHQPFII